MQNTPRKDSVNGNGTCCTVLLGHGKTGTELEGERQKCKLLTNTVTSGKQAFSDTTGPIYATGKTEGGAGKTLQDYGVTGFTFTNQVTLWLARNVQPIGRNQEYPMY